MPLNSKGAKILASMRSQYGAKKGTSVFYASINKGKISGVEGRRGKQAGGAVDLPYSHLKGVRINPRNWERFLAQTPRSTNIEDRRDPDAVKLNTMMENVMREKMQTGGTPDVRSFNSMVMQQNPMWGQMMPQLPSQAAPQAMQGRGWGGLKGSMSQDPRFQGLREGFQSMWQQSPFGRLGEMFSRFRQHVPQGRAEGGRLNPFQFMGDPLTTEIDKLGAGMTRGAASPGPGRGSVVVDKEGKPLTMYHGTNRVYIDPENRLGGSQNEAFHYTQSPRVASNYATSREGGNPNVRPAYLDIKNPLYVKQDSPEHEKFSFLTKDMINELRSKGHDGIIIKRSQDVGLPPDRMGPGDYAGDISEAIVFGGSQITPKFRSRARGGGVYYRHEKYAEGGKIKSDEQREQEELIAAAGALAEDTPVMKALRLPVKKPKKAEGLAGKQGGGKISSEFRLPWAARTAMYGLRPNRSKPLIGPTPGRADKRPENVASGSYVLPADVVSAIGQGNSIAGMNKIRKKFGKAEGGGVGIGKKFAGMKMESYGGGRFRMPGVPGLKRGQYALGGPPRDVPIAASDGEHILTPEEVTAFGGGDIKRGHDRLDKWVLDTRAKHIKQLKRLKPPKKD